MLYIPLLSISIVRQTLSLPASFTYDIGYIQHIHMYYIILHIALSFNDYLGVVGFVDSINGCFKLTSSSSVDSSAKVSLIFSRTPTHTICDGFLIYRYRLKY